MVITGLLAQGFRSVLTGLRTSSLPTVLKDARLEDMGYLHVGLTTKELEVLRRVNKP